MAPSGVAESASPTNDDPSAHDSLSTKRAITSCLLCRRRKIRCSRERPRCQTCEKLNHRCEYITPVRGQGDPTPPQQPLPDAPQVQQQAGVKSRLANIEVLMRNLLHNQQKLLLSSGVKSVQPEIAEESSKSPDDVEDSDSQSPQNGVTVTVFGEPRYVVGSYWRELVAQTEEVDLETFLDGPRGSDDDAVHAATASTASSNPVLFAQADPSFSLAEYLPDIHEARELYRLFTKRIDPIARLIHKPSFVEEFERYYAKFTQSTSVADLHSAASGRIDYGFTALMFAIFYSAVNSLQGPVASNELVLSHPLPTYLEKMKYATEQALLRSQVIDRPGLNSVTALGLLAYLMCHEHVPGTFALAGALLRMSKALSLHIDPLALAQRAEAGPAQRRGRRMDIVEAERRRRLWHMVLHLDFMVCEAQGIDPDEAGYEMWPAGIGTAHPVNVDDEELEPGVMVSSDSSERFPQDRQRFTDMTVYLVRLEIGECFRKLATDPALPSASSSPLDGMAIIETMSDRINNLYTRYCVKSDPIQAFTILLAEAGKQRALLGHYSQQLRGMTVREDGTWPVARRQAMVNAINLLSTHRTVMEDPNICPLWWHKRHSVYTVIYILKEMLVNDPQKAPRDIHSICVQGWESVTKLLITISTWFPVPFTQTRSSEHKWRLIDFLGYKVQQKWFPKEEWPQHLTFNRYIPTAYDNNCDSQVDFDFASFLQETMDLDMSMQALPMDMQF